MIHVLHLTAALIVLSPSSCTMHVLCVSCTVGTRAVLVPCYLFPLPLCAQVRDVNVQDWPGSGLAVALVHQSCGTTLMEGASKDI